jgi:hypothetical protein
MKAKWLIEDYEHDSSLNPIIDEIKNQGMEYSIVKYEPWASGEFNQYEDNDCVIFYGTLNLGRQLQRDKSWVPGVYCNFKNLCCKTYYSYWAKYLLNHEYIMIPMIEILRRREYVFNNFGKRGCIFIRPDSGAKPITGQVIEYDTLDKEFDLFKAYAGNDLDQIVAVVSSPKNIELEWRFLVVNKKVVAGSQYKKNNRLEISSFFDVEAFELADKIAKEGWQPDRIYTLDICKSNGEYFLLEANSFSCSGLYLCDAKKIVEAVSEAAVTEWEEYYEVID